MNEIIFLRSAPFTMFDGSELSKRLSFLLFLAFSFGSFSEVLADIPFVEDIFIDLRSQHEYEHNEIHPKHKEHDSGKASVDIGGFGEESEIEREEDRENYPTQGCKDGAGQLSKKAPRHFIAKALIFRS